MSGLFQLLSIGARSLSAAQIAQATVGNNAANAATVGYTRRRVTLAEAPSVEVGSLRLGTGVTVDEVARLRNAFVDLQRRLDRQELNYSKAQADVLGRAEALFGAADTSALGTGLDELFAAFGDLAARPEDVAVRRTVIAQAQSLVDTLHQTRRRLDQLEADTFDTIRQRVDEVNGLAARVAEINAATTQSSPDPALADERDRLIDRLAELIGVQVTTRGDGSVQVVVGGTGVQLVDGVRAGTLAVTGSPTGGTVALSLDGVALDAPRGELGGLLAARNSSTDGLPAVIADLDTLASGVITAVNRVHASGAGLTLAQSVTGSVAVANPAAMLDSAGLTPTPVSGTLTLGVFTATGTFVGSGGVTVDPATMSLNDLAAAIDALPDVSATVSGGRLVISATNPANRIAFGPDTSDALVALGVNGFFTGTGAADIDVSPDLVSDPSRIAAAQADFAAGVVSPGDGRNARALQALATSRVFTGGTQTASEFFAGMGAALGATVHASSARADVQQALLAASEAQFQSASGVNVDEELTDMVRYQHAYEAAARYISTVDEMLRALMEMV